MHKRYKTITKQVKTYASKNQLKILSHNDKLYEWYFCSETKYFISGEHFSGYILQSLIKKYIRKQDTVQTKGTQSIQNNLAQMLTPQKKRSPTRKLEI